MRRLRIFISYARVDKAFASQVAHLLQRHEVWYDHRLAPGDDWWVEIEQRLGWCEIFIYLLTPESVMSSFCLKELQIALKTNKFIIPILLSMNVTIPKAIRHLQYLDGCQGIGVDAVTHLRDALEDWSLNHPVTSSTETPSVPATLDKTPNDVYVPASSSSGLIPPPPMIKTVEDTIAMIQHYTASMGQGNFEEALYVAEKLRDSGHQMPYMDFNACVIQAEQSIKDARGFRQREANYRAIAELIKEKTTRSLGCQSFQMFRRDFPDYDPQNLAQYCANQTQGFAFPQMPPMNPMQNTAPYMRITDMPMPTPRYLPSSMNDGHTVSNPRKSLQMPLKSILPNLEWCEVPATAIEPAFLISKYPVTNAQFMAFIKHPKGYAQPAWWNFSRDAWSWREKHPQASEGRFTSDSLPRESVPWYDMIAFSRWLSKLMGEKISLPLLTQWRRAAQGRDRRIYPWGNDFSPRYCNSKESRLGRTTEVTRYMHGVSSVGAMDMGGNVWELLLDGERTTELSEQMLQIKANRWMIGGSFATPQEKLKISFQYSIDPEQYLHTIGFRLVMLEK